MSSGHSFESKDPGTPWKECNASAISIQSTLPPGNLDGLAMNIDDLELLHHYSTSTCNAFSEDPLLQRMYRVDLPRLGLTHQYVLRLLLALAGRHMLYLETCDSPAKRYSTLAEDHVSIALQQVTALLSDLNTYNCQALYISSVLICHYVFARGPEPGEYLVFSEHGPPQWLPLLRGVRSILESMGYEKVYSGVLEPMRSHGIPQHADTSAAKRLNLLAAKWERPLLELKNFIASSAPSKEAYSYPGALDNLTRQFKATLGSDEDGSYNGQVISQNVFRWLYVLQDEFIELLQQKRPHALIVVAYFTVLVHVMESNECWFLQGWTNHILSGIYQSVEEDYRAWLQWPMETVGMG